jgi:MFS family permease
LLVVGLGTLLAALDTAVNIALPEITQAFGLALEDIRWVVIVYVLTYASLMIACGRMGDLIGYRPVFQLGLVLSGLGFVACALAGTYAMLLFGRLTQGVGIALTLSCAPALAISMVGESERARALAFYAGVMAAGAALGPVAGGILIAHWDWPAVFWVRIPVAALAFALSWLLAAPPPGGSMRGFDLAGAALLIAWMVGALLAVGMMPSSYDAVLPGGLLLLSLFAFVLFLLREAQCPRPLMRLTPFRDLDFALFNLASVIVNLAAFSILILVPYYLVRVAAFDVVTGGAVLAVSAIGTVLGSWCAGWLNRRMSLGPPTFAGIMLNVGGLWAISTWSETTPWGLVASALLVQGFGLGLFQVGYTDYVTATLPLAERGVAGSLTMVTRTIGVVLGATGLATALTHLEGAARAAGLTAERAFLAGFQPTFRYVAAGLAAFLAIILMRPGLWRLRV